MKKYVAILFSAILIVGIFAYRAQADRSKSSTAPIAGVKGGFITDARAEQLVTRFQQSPYGDNTHYVTFSREHFDKILSTPGVVDIRITFAMEDQNRIVTVVAGYDANNRRLTQQLDISPPCPPWCPGRPDTLNQ